MDRRRRRTGSEPARRTIADAPEPRSDPDRPTVYQIQVKGLLDDRWTGSREGLSITCDESGDTVLTVPVVDQSALHGLLRKLRDIGVPLVSINPARSELPTPSREEKER